MPPLSKTDTSTSVQTNQQGQTLGRKGLKTREKLMAAARKLLEVHSPVELTAVAIAKEAGTSSASFYMYFEDVRDILFTLATEAGAAMSVVHDIVQQPWEAGSVHQHALRMVEQFNATWQAHRQVLRFRNLEADRGDPRFEALRMSTYLPFIGMLARQILAASLPDRPRPTRTQALALATVLHAAMERLASVDPAVVARGVGTDKLNEAIAHTIVLAFGSATPQPDATETAEPEPASRAKAARKQAAS